MFCTKLNSLSGLVMQSFKSFGKNGTDMQKYSKLTREYLHECLLYDNGKLYWKARPANHFSSKLKQKQVNSRFAGKIAGSKTKNGYRILIDSIQLYDTQLIWLMFKDGPLPSEIGFKDFNSKNRVLENLIGVCRGESSGLSKSTNTGYKRIYKRDNTYIVRFTRENISRSFKDINNAIEYTKDKIKEFGYRDVI